MIEDGLETYLKAQPTVSAIVGTRVYPIRKPKVKSKLNPYIVYRREDTDRVFSLTGFSGLTEATIQIGCWADTYGAAKRLADAVRLVVDGYAGLMGAYTVQMAKIDHENDTSDLHPENKEREMFGVFMWLDINFCETVPDFS
jgi:hypothetical protein